VLEEVIMSWALSAVLLCTCTYLHDGKGTVTVYVGLWSPRGISKHRGRPSGDSMSMSGTLPPTFHNPCCQFVSPPPLGPAHSTTPVLVGTSCCRNPPSYFPTPTDATPTPRHQEAA
jgi:hypothetical protein